MLSSRPHGRGQDDEYPSVAAQPTLWVDIEANLFPEHKLIVLSFYSTQEWALMRLMVI